MISTRRGLLILGAITILLSVLLGRELRRARVEPVDRALLPGLDPERITELVWDRSPLPEVKVTGTGTSWTWTSTSGTARAEARVVREVLSTLRAARWHRRAEVAAAGKLHSQLSLTVGTTARVIGIGAPLPGTEQTWIVIGDHALLVDAWVARALDPEPLALRVRRPIDDASAVPVITFLTSDGLVRLEGIPRRQLSPRILLVRPGVVSQLEHALEQLELVRLSRAPQGDGPVLEVNLGRDLRLRPVCPDDPALAWLSSDVGDGCITREAYANVATALHAFEGPAEDVIEPRPLPAELDAIVLVDGNKLELAGRPLVGGKAVDPTAVAELLAVLSAPAEVVVPPVNPKVLGHLRIAVRGGAAITLELLGGNLVRRELEPLALRLSPGAYARLNRPAAELEDRTLWTEEPTAITAIQIDATTYARGAVIGEWTRTPPGPFVAAQLEAVVAGLASPRSAPPIAAFARAHQVTLTVTNPTGAPIQHVLAIGRTGARRCAATTSEVTMILLGAVCDAVDALAR